MVLAPKNMKLFLCNVKTHPMKLNKKLIHFLWIRRSPPCKHEYHKAPLPSKQSLAMKTSHARKDIVNSNSKPAVWKANAKMSTPRTVYDVHQPLPPGARCQDVTQHPTIVEISKSIQHMARAAPATTQSIALSRLLWQSLCYSGQTSNHTIAKPGTTTCLEN